MRIVSLPFSESECLQRVELIRQSVSQLQNDGVISAWDERPKRLLDVGGASGVFAYLFRDKGWGVEIVDPAPQGCFIEEYGIVYHKVRFDESFDSSAYDLISMNYVLEHARSPHELLKAAYSRLTAAGVLYIEVPDAIAFMRKDKEDDIFNSCHLWMFSVESITQLLSKSGFEILLVQRKLSPRGHYSLCVLAKPELRTPEVIARYTQS